MGTTLIRRDGRQSGRAGEGCRILDANGTTLHPEVLGCSHASIAAGRTVLDVYGPRQLVIYDTPAAAPRVLPLPLGAYAYPLDVGLAPTGDRFYTVDPDAAGAGLCVYDLVAAK